MAGHCNPVVYATLAVMNEALRIKHRQTGDLKYQNIKGNNFQLVWKNLLTLRKNGGLPGHAEMDGKTLFFKFNTGPSGHGSPAAAGEALALKLAGTPEVKVFAFEGEGGFTTGASHETINSAWGLGLGNLVYFMDWNDYGIDNRPFSSIMYGGPKDWFSSHGWHVEGVEDVATFPALFMELARRGWTDQELSKLAGENLLRVMRETEAVAMRLQRERPPSTKTYEELDGGRGGFD